MTLPLKINAEGHELMSLKAVIDSNAWAPYNAIVNGFDYQRQLDPEVTPGAPVNPWNGFLSLRKTQETVIPSNTTNEAYYNEHNRGNRTYYETARWSIRIAKQTALSRCHGKEIRMFLTCRCTPAPSK